jgi:hypothetical protein
MDALIQNFQIPLSLPSLGFKMDTDKERQMVERG